MQAALYVNRRFLSTPFTCPNPNRQGEMAICLLADQLIVDVSLVPGCINEDGRVNLIKVQEEYKSPAVKVVYRPNHDLLHSLRQAALTMKIKDYFDQNTTEKYAHMTPKHM